MVEIALAGVVLSAHVEDEHVLVLKLLCGRIAAVDDCVLHRFGDSRAKGDRVVGTLAELHTAPNFVNYRYCAANEVVEVGLASVSDYFHVCVPFVLWTGQVTLDVLGEISDKNGFSKSTRKTMFVA